MAGFHSDRSTVGGGLSEGLTVEDTGVYDLVTEDSRRPMAPIPYNKNPARNEIVARGLSTHDGNFSNQWRSSGIQAGSSALI